MSSHDVSAPDMNGVQQRPTAQQSLIHGVAPLRPGTLVAQAIGAGITVAPREGRMILFGRQADEVHVCIGGDDLGMSRKHGLLTCEQGHWWVRNVGCRPMRLPSGELFTNGDPVPLATGYTPLFVTGSQGRQHLLELYVVGPGGDRPRARPNHETLRPTIWPLTADELIAVIVLGQRYLRHEPNPQPLCWQQAAEELALLDPEGDWTAKRLEHKVVKVRHRLSSRGVYGLLTSEVPKPVGNQLNDNLIRELVRSTTLVPTDLSRLDL
ncbi:MAG: FHA domain-containing protein [Pseudonocardia sp.]